MEIFIIFEMSHEKNRQPNQQMQIGVNSGQNKTKNPLGRAKQVVLGFQDFQDSDSAAQSRI